MKIYLATPVNGRKEKTLREKMKGALAQVQKMARYILKQHPDAEFMSSFEIPDIRAIINDHVDVPMPSEAKIMGECVRMVMECDMIVLDENWRDSRGCWVEQTVAQQYGIRIESYARLLLMEKLKEQSV